MPKQHAPERGDIVWLSFHPQAGHEQAGRRPAIVVSPKIYNQKSGLAIFCPITSQVKRYPFEVYLPPDCQIQGVILSDQVKSLDWKAREAKLICVGGSETVDEVLGKIRTLLQ